MGNVAALCICGCALSTCSCARVCVWLVESVCMCVYGLVCMYVCLLVCDSGGLGCAQVDQALQKSEHRYVPVHVGVAHAPTMGKGVSRTNEKRCAIEAVCEEAQVIVLLYECVCLCLCLCMCV